MFQVKKTDYSMLFYSFSILLYLLVVYDVNWFYSFSFFPIRIFIVAVCLSKLMNSNIASRNKYFAISFFLFLSCLYGAIISLRGNTYLVLSYLAIFVSMASIIGLSKDQKEFLLNFIINSFVVILTISLAAWILYLLGIHLPHSSLILHRNGFHEYYDYYFFRLTYHSSIGIFPRFSSIFLEAGQLGTPCVFLLYLNAVKNKLISYKNIVLFVAILLSFSLIAYGLLIFALVTITWIKGSKYRLPLTVVVILLLAGVSLYFISTSDSVINELIFSRLESDDEKIITGNNRTSIIFDSRFDVFIKSEDRYLGIHNQLSSGYDWTFNCSGLKKAIVHYGIVGLFINSLFIISLFWKSRSMSSLCFLIILIISYYVRDLLFNPMWLSIAILGFLTFSEECAISQERIKQKGVLLNTNKV